MSLKLKSKFRVIASSFAAVVVVSGVAYASDTPEFSQTINAGAGLVADVLDGNKDPVANPSVNMTAQNFSFDCQTSTGTLGSASERLYVINPSFATGGWTLTVAAADGPTALWENGGSTLSFDFNDPSGTPTGCDNGQLAIDADAGTLTADCETCTNANISKGTSSAFNQGSADSVTLLNAGPSSDNVWRGYLTGVDVSQTIPAEQEADTYTINLELTATAQ